MQQSAAIASAPTEQQTTVVTGRTMVAMTCQVQWQCEHARHTDGYHAMKLNLGRDLVAPELERQLCGQPVGTTASHTFAAGDLLPAAQDQDVLQIPASCFNRRLRRFHTVEPLAGRYYPRGYIAGVADIAPEDRRPFRVARVGEQLEIDLKHPLAHRELTLSAVVGEAWPAGDEHDSRCNDLGEMVTENGPGMQTRWRDLPTDFWSGQPFKRELPTADAEFYTQARMVHHIDSTARGLVRDLYARLADPAGETLDLMSSWVSHLPTHWPAGSVVGLGLNAEELAANPVLGEYLVQDLNADPKLPLADGRFSSVICTVSVEYLTRPLEVFAEIRRVLRPGGRCVITFSDRWFPPKVIALWQELHAFERMGLVLEYFLQDGGFTDLETWSMRGLPRPEDDKYANRLACSDPIFAVWGSRA